MDNEVVIHVTSDNDVKPGFDGARREVKVLAKDTIDAGKDAGMSFGKSLTQSVSAASGSMGPILAGAGVVAAPLIGASIAGAVVGGAGIGGVIGGVLLASKDTRVQSAGGELSKRFMDTLNKDAGVFVQPMLKSIDTIGAKFDSLQPRIRSIFDNSSSFLEPLTEGITSGAGKVIEGFADAVESAGPVIDAFSRSFDEVGGAIGEVFTTLSDDADEGASAVDDLTGSMVSFVKATGGTIHALAEIHGALDTFDGEIDSGREHIEDFFTKLSGGRAEFDITADGMSIAEARAKKLNDELAKGEVVGKWMPGTADGVKALGEEAEESAEGLKAFVDAAEKAIGASRSLFDTTTDVAQAEDEVRESIKKNGKTLDEHTEKGQANRDVLSKLAKTLKSNYDAYAEVNGQGPQTDAVADSNRASFIRLAGSLGASKARANELANSILGIPARRNVTVFASTAAAQSAINRLEHQLDGIPDQQVNIRLRQIWSSSVVNQDAAMARRGKASGGVVGAAANGATSEGLTWTGENGPELLDLPPGTSVHTAGDSKRIAASQGGGGQMGPIIVQVVMDSKVVAESVVDPLQYLNRTQWSGQMFAGSAR